MSEFHQEHRAVYVRTAKTACRSTATWLKEEYAFESGPEYHEFASLLPGREDWLWFTTVRHPYDRARSLWEWALHTSPDLFPGLSADVASLYFEGFLEWLVYRLPTPAAEKLAAGWKWGPELGLMHFRNQTDYLEPLLRWLWLFPFERVPYCYKVLPFVDGISHFPHLNRAPGQVPAGRKTNRKKDLVQLWAPRDRALCEIALERGRGR